MGTELLLNNEEPQVPTYLPYATTKDLVPSQAANFPVAAAKHFNVVASVMKCNANLETDCLFHSLRNAG